jgi:hypothetical protein
MTGAIAAGLALKLRHNKTAFDIPVLPCLLAALFALMPQPDKAALCAPQGKEVAGLLQLVSIQKVVV